ncbi:hypothetical protein J6590_031318 [Homalodisca vitripennis]|nr:hypothetical protein J6590_031318 [Homalodisca vitripennis]
MKIDKNANIDHSTATPHFEESFPNDPESVKKAEEALSRCDKIDIFNTFTAVDEHARHAKMVCRAVDEQARYTAAAFILPQCELSSCPGRL